MTSNTPSFTHSQSEEENLFKKHEIFKIEGRDKRGYTVLRVIGKYFPARLLSVDALKKYLEDEIFPSLGESPFSVVYVNTGVNRSDNFPGISALRSIYEAIPIKIKENLDSIYFLHPGFQSRLFLATFGRLVFPGPGGWYWKVRYVNRLEFLWENVRRKEIEIPEYVYEEEEEMEYRPPILDYGMESDHPRLYGAPILDCTISTYSMRGIA
ncbi:SEC14 cytosolic factor family protein/phosphoglyceride transfer family protein [Abeliophyllum distichum]|uniref:SEC14 cytosolic factor family protein/phosphoglyceride transfer family protein n=1 Tax=Abeliophyllum distichum TaxID=126358 RepID=A0ABD1NPD3_9LAMI